MSFRLVLMLWYFAGGTTWIRYLHLAQAKAVGTVRYRYVERRELLEKD